MPDHLLTGYLPEATAAKQLKKSIRVLRRSRQAGKGPPFIRLGKTVYYPINGVLGWLKSLEEKPVRQRKRGRV